MSSVGFNPRSGPILVDAEIIGPAGSVVWKLVLDTGATTSLINLTTLLSLGFDPDQSTQRISMTTGSTVAVVRYYTEANRGPEVFVGRVAP